MFILFGVCMYVHTNTGAHIWGLRTPGFWGNQTQVADPHYYFKMCFKHASPLSALAQNGME